VEETVWREPGVATLEMLFWRHGVIEVFEDEVLGMDMPAFR